MADYRQMWDQLQGILGDVALAPARGYLAQSPKTDFGNGLLGSFLNKAHQAIDPVNGLGGYGGLLAMALPPGAPKIPYNKLIPAIQYRDGSILSGTRRGQPHFEIYELGEKAGRGPANETGFIDSGTGKFFSSSDVYKFNR